MQNPATNYCSLTTSTTYLCHRKNVIVPACVRQSCKNIDILLATTFLLGPQSLLVPPWHNDDHIKGLHFILRGTKSGKCCWPCCNAVLTRRCHTLSRHENQKLHVHSEYPHNTIHENIRVHWTRHPRRFLPDVSTVVRTIQTGLRPAHNKCLSEHAGSHSRGTKSQGVPR